MYKPNRVAQQLLEPSMSAAPPQQLIHTAPAGPQNVQFQSLIKGFFANMVFLDMLEQIKNMDGVSGDSCLCCAANAAASPETALSPITLRLIPLGA